MYVRVIVKIPSRRHYSQSMNPFKCFLNSCHSRVNFLLFLEAGADQVSTQEKENDDSSIIHVRREIQLIFTLFRRLLSKPYCWRAVGLIRYVTLSERERALITQYPPQLLPFHGGTSLLRRLQRPTPAETIRQGLFL
jgi:hypothetical protein